MLKKLGMLLMLAWAISPAWAQEALPPAPPSTHTLSQQLARIGAFSCAARANQLASFLSPGYRDITLLHIPANNADRSLLSATLLVPTGPQQTALANIALAPNQANGCAGMYQTIVYKAMACAKALADDYPKVKTQALGETAILMGGIDRNARILAMPADKGCILMKQEMVE